MTDGSICFDSNISIHALLAESDLNPIKPRRFHYHFYPRSPCGERLEEVSGDTWARDFYPRSPCGERPVTTVVVGASRDFYPRSPCGERRRNC